jgi:predicted DNA-binding ribbon-helix-helix protein
MQRSIRLDAATWQCLQAMADADHDGNVSMTIRLLVRKAGAERGLWPTPDAPKDGQP